MMLDLLGKISADNLGQKYEEGLIQENVQYFYNKKKRDFTHWNMFNFKLPPMLREQW